MEYAGPLTLLSSSYYSSSLLDIPQEISVLHDPLAHSPGDEEMGTPCGGPETGMALTESWPSKGQIEFRHVWMRYRPTTPDVLRGISFVVRGGERVGICGRTGSGNSIPPLVPTYFHREKFHHPSTLSHRGGR
jgi:ABC-type multidrug transport system fused ATPase/permease subunit